MFFCQVSGKKSLQNQLDNQLGALQARSLAYNDSVQDKDQQLKQLSDENMVLKSQVQHYRSPECLVQH